MPTLLKCVCKGCDKSFEKPRYLLRKNNYCSIKCYWDSTRLKTKRRCICCKKEFVIKNYLVKQGYGIFCSRECQHKTYPLPISKFCEYCHKEMKVQPSKVDLVKYCSKECKDNNARDYVECTCKNCNVIFGIPRWELNKGKGNFCSWQCFIQFKGESTLEERVRKILEGLRLNFSQEVKIGKYRADFLIGNTILECDGEYWHSSEKAMFRDSNKDKFLKSKGYKIVRFKGSFIHKTSIEELSKKVLSIVN